MPTDLKTLVGGLYDLLEPVDAADRKKAIKAVLTMLGDEQAVTTAKPSIKSDEDAIDEASNYPVKAQQWMKKFEVSEEQLAHVFHVENGKAEVIAHEAPGTSIKQRAINAYVLTGISQLLASGEAKFDDKTARATCKSLGCFDEGNHAYNLKGKGNLFGGSKEAGWTLTGPGLKSGADMVKGLATA